MNNTAQPSSYQLPDLMIDDMFVITDMPLTKTQTPEFDMDMLLAQELLSDLMPISQRRSC